MNFSESSKIWIEKNWLETGSWAESDSNILDLMRIKNQ